MPIRSHVFANGPDRALCPDGPPLLFMTLTGVSVYRGMARYRQSFAQLNQTSDSLSGTDALFGLLKDAETGQRGYLLTGKLSYLEPYQTAERSIEPYLGALDRRAGEISLSGEWMEHVRSLIRDKMAELGETIVLYKTGRRRTPSTWSTPIKASF